MEKYSFNAKKQRIINENKDTIGLNNVARQNTPNIPHHVFTFTVSPVKSLVGCCFLTMLIISWTDNKARKIIDKVHTVLSRKAPPYHISIYV